MKILIVEPETKGHFISLYVRSYLKSLGNNIQLFLLTSKDIKKKKIFKILKKEKPNLKLLYCKKLIYSDYKNPFILLYYQFINYINIKKKIKKYNKKIKFDKIFFTNLDHIDKALSFVRNPFNSIKFSGILVNPRIHQFYKKNFNVKYLIYFFFIKSLFLKKNLEFILSNDILFYKYAKNKSQKLIYFNEPILKENNSSDINNIFEKNFLNILVYGAIRNSKSLEELIKLIKIAKKRIKIKAVVAGIQSKEIIPIMNKINLLKNEVKNNFKIINRFITPQEENYLFSHTSLVWCVYKDTPLGSSGVLHLSFNYQKPILTNNEGLVGWYNKKYKIGPILNFNSDAKIKKSVDKIIKLHKDKSIYSYYVNNQRKLFKKLKKEKTFKEIIFGLYN